MKQNILFKTLIDILFFLQCFGLLGAIFILPTNIGTISQANMSLETWNIIHWIIFALSTLGYLLFLIGIYFLRKMARHYLSNKPFSINIIQCLKKSGQYFILHGMVTIGVIIIQFTEKLFNSTMKFTYDVNVQMSILTIIVGLFFIIQSNTLINARKLKDENDLTI
jgi:hypothetical protein